METKKHKIFKIISIISFILNALFTTLIIFACANTTEEPKTALKTAKNNRLFNLPNDTQYNEYITGYKVFELSERYDLSNLEERQYNYSFDDSVIITLSTFGNDFPCYTYYGGNFSVYVSTDVVLANNDFIRIAYQKDSSVFTSSFVYSGGNWVYSGNLYEISFYSSNEYLDNQLIYQLSYLFNGVSSRKVNLRYWQPWQLFGSSNFLITSKQNDVNYVFDIFNNFPVIVNGNIYNRLYITLTLLDGDITIKNSDGSFYSTNKARCITQVALTGVSGSVDIFVAKNQFTDTGAFYFSNDGYKPLSLDIVLPNVNGDVSSLISGFKNSNIFDLGSITSNTNDSANIGNAFTLIGSAFTSLAGLFNIGIIPGITIGVLLFIPLIVGIILAIVRLIKK